MMAMALISGRISRQNQQDSGIRMDKGSRLASTTAQAPDIPACSAKRNGIQYMPQIAAPPVTANTGNDALSFRLLPGLLPGLLAALSLM